MDEDTDYRWFYPDSIPDDYEEVKDSNGNSVRSFILDQIKKMALCKPKGIQNEQV